MFTVYVLESDSTGKFYVGQTGNLERRLFEHQQGLTRYTRSRGPWHLAYKEEHHTRAAAMQREQFLKSGQGREWLRNELSSRVGPP